MDQAEAEITPHHCVEGPDVWGVIFLLIQTSRMGVGNIPGDLDFTNRFLFFPLGALPRETVMCAIATVDAFLGTCVLMLLLSTCETHCLGLTPCLQAACGRTSHTVGI